jgi:hypothetical protein
MYCPYIAYFYRFKNVPVKAPSHQMRFVFYRVVFRGIYFIKLVIQCREHIYLWKTQTVFGVNAPLA